MDEVAQASGGAEELPQPLASAQKLIPANKKPAVSVSGRPHSNVGTHRDGPLRLRNDPPGQWIFHADNKLNDRAPATANLGRSRRNFHPQCKVNLEYISLCPLLQDTWENERTYPAIPGYVIHNEEDPSLVYEFNLLVLAARTKASK